MKIVQAIVELAMVALLAAGTVINMVHRVQCLLRGHVDHRIAIWKSEAGKHIVFECGRYLRFRYRKI
jgi:hypothetical protein